MFQVDLSPSQVICLFCLPNIPVFQIPSKLPSLKLFLLKNGIYGLKRNVYGAVTDYILFDENLDDFEVENQNTIKNSLWIKKTDLGVIK